MPDSVLSPCRFPVGAEAKSETVARFRSSSSVVRKRARPFRLVRKDEEKFKEEGKIYTASIEFENTKGMQSALTVVTHRLVRTFGPYEIEDSPNNYPSPGSD